MLPILEEACRATVFEYLNLTRIWETYTYSVCLQDEELREKCRDYFRKSVSGVERALKSPTFLRIPVGVLQDFLEINDNKPDEHYGNQKSGILISEVELFQACNMWAQVQCHRQKIVASGGNKRMVLGDCLFLIRFPTMLASDIAKFVSPTNILFQAERLDLLEHALAVPEGNVNPSDTGFLDTDQSFLLSVNQGPYGKASRIKSPFNHEALTYSQLSFVVHKRLRLSGIWFVPPQDPPYSSKHEVVIRNRAQILGSEPVVSQPIGKPGRPIILYLPLNPVILEADEVYSIIVQQKGESVPGFRDPENILMYQSMLQKMKFMADVKLEIAKSKKNECINAFTVSLI